MQDMLYRLTLFVLAVFLFSGCGGSPATKTSSPENILASARKVDKRNDALMMSALVQQTPIEESYLIGPEDVLEIEAYNVEELKKTVRVNSKGDIALPLVGVISVKGLTTSEVEQVIAKKLDKYVQETAVSVFVKEYKSQRISVIGAVNKPNVFAVTGQRYILDMLMMAEGLAKEAGSICYVIRPTLKSGSPAERSTTIVIDLDELLAGGDLSLNIPVFAGDAIHVPKGGLIFVDGSVKTPGAYTFRSRSTTLVQAISMAQGMNADAALSDIKIFRDSGKGERDIIPADYDAIRKGEQPDILLAENDIIIVPQSGVKNFFNGFVNTLKGFISFGAYPVF
jgi:polysaccharide export outer membrane protein